MLFRHVIEVQMQADSRVRVQQRTLLLLVVVVIMMVVQLVKRTGANASPVVSHHYCNGGLLRRCNASITCAFFGPEAFSKVLKTTERLKQNLSQLGKGFEWYLCHKALDEATWSSASAGSRMPSCKFVISR